MANYSGSRISQCVANDGDTLSGHNFCQEQPYTPILEGLTGLTFVDCNLVNCKVPAGSTIISSNISQIDRCSHLHDWLSYQCEENCRHVVGSEDIVVDGVVVDTIREYADISLPTGG